MKNKKKTEPIIYSIPEVASLLHTSPNYVYELVKSGKLKSIKIRSLKVIKANLLDFLNENVGMDISDVNNFKELEFDSNE